MTVNGVSFRKTLNRRNKLFEHYHTNDLSCVFDVNRSLSCVFDDSFERLMSLEKLSLVSGRILKRCVVKNDSTFVVAHWASRHTDNTTRVFVFASAKVFEFHQSRVASNAVGGSGQTY